tara:strand:- start:155 stop:400 length:246 start_codon:yes stop_codon:yes gene_type:complete
MSLQQILPYIAGGISIGGIIFKTGQHAEKLEVLGYTVEAQEKKVTNNFNIIHEIHSDISILKNDISYMKQDIHDIKNKLDK